MEVQMVRVKYVVWILIGVLLALAGCAQDEAAPADEVVIEAPGTMDEGGLDLVTRLALGTLKLEGTGNAVSAEQAADLLPLWRALASGTLQGEAENAAVLGQIEGKMDAEQLAAIDGMGLTVEDTRAWMEEQGLEMGAPEGGPEQAGQAPGALQNLSEKERAKMRTEMQNLTAEERATRTASLPSEAQGFQRPEGQEAGGPPPGGAGRQASVLVGPLVELLAERSAG
jgi:hypothetical protein